MLTVRIVAAVVLFGDMSRILGQGTLATGTNCEVTCNATAVSAMLMLQSAM